MQRVREDQRRQDRNRLYSRMLALVLFGLLRDYSDCGVGVFVPETAIKVAVKTPDESVY